MDLADLSDGDLLARWNAQQPTDDGTSPLLDALADEIELRGLDF